MLIEWLVSMELIGWLEKLKWKISWIVIFERQDLLQEILKSIVEHLNKTNSIVNQLASMKIVLDDELHALILRSSLLEGCKTLVVTLVTWRWMLLIWIKLLVIWWMKRQEENSPILLIRRYLLNQERDLEVEVAHLTTVIKAAGVQREDHLQRMI